MSPSFNFRLRFKPAASLFWPLAFSSRLNISTQLQSFPNTADASDIDGSLAIGVDSTLTNG